MMQQEPQEGDEMLGIITKIDTESTWYWTLTVPSLPGVTIHSHSRSYLPNPKHGFSKCPVDTEQICMFRYSRWLNPSSGLVDEDCYWQPVLDYFETNRQEQ